MPDLGLAVRVSADAIEAVMESSIGDADWEAAVLDRTLGRRKFRRLTEVEIAELRAG